MKYAWINYKAYLNVEGLISQENIDEILELRAQREAICLNILYTSSILFINVFFI